MGSLYVGGLISGANTEDLIRKIMEVERIRLTNREAEKARLEAQQKAWADVRSQLSALQSKLDTLRFPFVYRSRKVTLTDESVASVTASTGAALTTYSLNVTYLAQSHVVSHSDATTMASPNDQLGFSGSFTIGLASGTTQQIDFTTSDTLNSLADKINAANVGVSASVVKVDIGGTDKYRLVLTSSQTGVDNAIVMEDVTAGTLEQLGFKNADGTWAKEISAARDAEFTLNGIDYKRSSNVIDDVVPGLTITLKKENASTQFTVSLDADKVLESVKAWVDEINKTQDLLKKLSDYNSDTKEAGVLNGDSIIRNLQRKIRSVLSNVVAGLPSDMNHLAQVGITTGAWGTADYGRVIIDEAKFKEAFEKNPEGVAMLFGAQRNNVALASNNATVALDAGSSTAAGYDLNDVINGVTDNDRFGSAGGGWMSGDAPAPGAPQGFIITFDGAKTIDQITLYQADTEDHPAATYGLRNYTLEYWDDATSSWKVIESVTDHTGVSKVFDFDPVTTTKVRLSVTETYNNYNVRITELQVGEYNNGAAIDMHRYIRSTLATGTGALDIRDTTLKEQIARLNDRIERIENQLIEREEQLRRQFARMEEAMAKLRSQGSVFAMMTLGLGLNG